MTNHRRCLFPNKVQLSKMSSNIANSNNPSTSLATKGNNQNKLKHILPRQLVAPHQFTQETQGHVYNATNINFKSKMSDNASQIQTLNTETKLVPDTNQVSLINIPSKTMEINQIGDLSSARVISLSDDEVNKLLSMSSQAFEVSDNSQVLHILTMDSSDDTQYLSVALDEQQFTSDREPDRTIVQECQELHAANHLEQKTIQAVQSDPQEFTVVSHSSLNDVNTPSLPNLPPESNVVKDGSANQREKNETTSHQSSSHSPQNVLGVSQPRLKEDDKTATELVGEGDREVVKKTVVEAFVKMVVCRKVTVQQIDRATGKVLDTQVKMEEEEPVILGVDCVETTEGANGSGQENSSTEKGAAGNRGLKLLDAVSKSNQSIGSRILADAILKSSLKKKKTGNDIIQPLKEPIDDKVINIKAEDDSEWADDDYNNDESEDYVPGKQQKTKKNKTKQRRKESSGKTSNEKVDKGVTKLKLSKKRGKKRMWDSALGIASNLTTCPFCNKHYKTAELCAKHMKKGKCVSSLFCFICSKVFQDEKELESHLKNHKDETVNANFECSDCNRIYRTKAGYVKHFRMGTCQKRDQFEDGEVGDFTCDICSTHFSSEAYLKLHKYKVHENPSDNHTCRDCGRKFYSLQGYKRHRKGRPCTEPLKCKICGKTYSSKAKESFKIHMRQHRTEATGVMFDCDECDRSYMTQMALTKHKLSHTGVKPYKCEVCGKEFAMRYMVKDHARVHTGERPYQCKLCGNSFSNKGHLGRHMRSHENGTLLKRGRPKKAPQGPPLSHTNRPIGLKIIELSGPTLMAERQALQVVDTTGFIDGHVQSQPMIIRTGHDTIIISENWPSPPAGANNVVPSGAVVSNFQTEEGTGSKEIPSQQQTVHAQPTTDGVDKEIQVEVHTSQNIEPASS